MLRVLNEEEMKMVSGGSEGACTYAFAPGDDGVGANPLDECTDFVHDISDPTVPPPEPPLFP